LSSVIPSFSTLGLSPASQQAIAQAGLTQPTPIQTQGIPPALAGQDLIGCAPTGTGKTLAFLVPAIERLTANPQARALVLTPTRELALQISEQFGRFARGTRLRSAVVIGGVAIEPQTRALAGRPELVVATPGRLIDHLESGTVRLDAVRILVLDEADRMLDMGFAPQLRRILAKLPKERQTMLFSATMAGEVAAFARTHLRTPVRVQVTPSGRTSARAEQRAYRVAQAEKDSLLHALLADEPGTSLVFVRTRRRADKLARSLERAGHRVGRLHSDRSQGQRRAALEGFRSGKTPILVATDIAARGIDVENIAHVVNYDVPHAAEDYVHRIGRTARAERSGRASTFVAPEDHSLLVAIERLTAARVPLHEVPRQHPAFVSEDARRRTAQAHPGPSQPRAAVPTSRRSPGRHARTHLRRS
jgi:ATP-dependent RNA helicase RhlE